MTTKKTIRAVAAVMVVAAVIVAAIALSQSSPGQQSKELTVYAAASLSAAFEEIGQGYEAAHPGVTVKFNFDGSANLKTQILNGADPDVFASADQKNMEKVASAGLLDNATREVFAYNRVVVIVPADNPGGIETLSDLTKSGLKIVIGDSSVPIGNYTRTVLDKMSADTVYGAGYRDQVMANVVSQESNVNNIVAKVALGEADAGFVYSTDAASAGDDVISIDVPDQYNVIAVYPIGVLADADLPAEAQAFVDYVLSAEGQAIMARYGFVTV